MSRIAWPNGVRCAAAIIFDMDADSLIHIATQDGWRRSYPVSMGRYGPTVAIPRIVETYRRLGLKQSFFIPGWCLESYRQAVETILRGGHEIGCHGWIHENPLERTRDEQAADLDRSLDAFDRIVGHRPSGYRAPVYQVTEHTVELLLERGFIYESSMMADDVPYLLRAGTGDLVEILPHWGIDDWPPFAHYQEIGYMMPVRGPAEGLAPFFEGFEAAYEAGGFWMAVVQSLPDRQAGPLAGDGALAGGCAGARRCLVRDPGPDRPPRAGRTRPGRRYPGRAVSLLHGAAAMRRHDRVAGVTRLLRRLAP